MAVGVVVILLLTGVAWAVVGRDDDGGTKAAEAPSTTGAGGSSSATTASSDGDTTAAESTDGGTSTDDSAALLDRPPPSGPNLTLSWSGDLVPASSDISLPDDPTVLLGKVERILKKPDLTIGNLEGTMTRRGSSKCGAGSSDCYAFRAPPSYANLLDRAGYDVMNLANNHAFDFGKVGLADTRAALDGVGIAYTGAPGQVTVREVEGVRVGIVGFASYKWSAPLNNLPAVKKLVQKADARADIVVVAFHGGAEGSDKQHVPNGRETQYGENRGNLRAFARAAIDAGADLVVGSGPHVVRGMQFYKGRLIAYSAGNFVGWEVFSLSGPLSVSYILEVTLKPDGTWVGGKMLATKLVDPGYADTDASGAAISSVRDLSKADFGKSAARIGDDGTIMPPGASS